MIRDQEYLVIKLPGGWIEREQARQKVKWAIDDIDVLDEKNVVVCRGAQLVRKEDCDRYKDLKDRTKERVAVALGKYLLERELISFVETKEGYNTIKIEGVVTVIRENRDEFAESAERLKKRLNDNPSIFPQQRCIGVDEIDSLVEEMKGGGE